MLTEEVGEGPSGACSFRVARQSFPDIPIDLVVLFEPPLKVSPEYSVDGPLLVPEVLEWALVHESSQIVDGLTHTFHGDPPIDRRKSGRTVDRDRSDGVVQESL